MNKMSLLLMILSVYAVHAADDEKEKELAMEQIEKIEQLTGYQNKVIAFTALSFPLCEGAFTLEQDGSTLHFGVVKYWYNSYNGEFGMQMKRFAKMDATSGYSDIARCRGDNQEEPLWKERDQAFIKRINLKVRWATEKEKEILKQAILTGTSKLDYNLSSSKAAALSYLAAD